MSSALKNYSAVVRETTESVVYFQATSIKDARRRLKDWAASGHSEVQERSDLEKVAISFRSILQEKQP